MNHLHVLRFVDIVVRHRRILVQDIFQKVPIGQVDSSANGLTKILVRFQLGVSSLWSLFFPLLFRLTFRVWDTVLRRLLTISFCLIRFHILELSSLCNADIVSLSY